MKCRHITHNSNYKDDNDNTKQQRFSPTPCTIMQLTEFRPGQFT